ncbi:MAG: 16S rRNA (uracil(1498)-N(3))-methyltransferase [Spirochaetales bacterium]|nr:16S rRNA (uracil(1498)-N(3))-methyltransferase [Spirochaetales bacterium]
MDNYEAAIALSQWKPEWKAYTLAIGSERGWYSGERNLLWNTGCTLASIGSHVLKTEIACVAGITVLLGRAGL